MSIQQEVNMFGCFALGMVFTVLFLLMEHLNRINKK